MSRGIHRDRFVVETTNGRRFDLALERFLAGQVFGFQDVCFRMLPSGEVCCAIDSSWGPENVTPETAVSDLIEGQASFRELVEDSPAFASLVQGKPVRYELVDDYGTGTLLLCSFEDGEQVWAPGFPKRKV